jgi:hypothetical protein
VPFEQATRNLADARRNFDGTLADFFSDRMSSCMADDGKTGPRHTLPVMLAILGSIESSVETMGGKDRRELLSVAARGAEFAGWLYRDLHDPGQARHWYAKATDWAQEARDLPMQGYILLRKAQMAYDNRDGTRVLPFSQAAHYGPWNLPVTVKAEVVQQEARGLAMTGGSIEAVERMLDSSRALHLSAASASSEQICLGAGCDEDTMALRTASCYLEAGRPKVAADLYRRVLASGVLSPRDRGYFLARLASALACAGEPDESAAAGIQAAIVATNTASTRTNRELHRALGTLRPWFDRAGPKQLMDVLSF